MTNTKKSGGTIFSLAITIALLCLMTAAIIPGVMGAEIVDLGTAGDYAILTKTGISTTGTTLITGNIGVSPAAATYMTGFGLIMDSSNQFSTSSLVTGNAYAADYAVPTPATMTTAISDMETAYTDAAGRAPDVTELGAGNIGGMTLAPGVYKWGTGLLIPTSTTLTLDLTAAGYGGSVWIFQVANDLTMETDSQMLLANGAQAENVYWQITGEPGVTMEAGTHAVGNILTYKLIAMKAGASLNGRALSQTAVTLIGNTIDPTAAAPAAAPVFVSAETNADGTVIIITFDKLMADPALDFGNFNYQIDGVGPEAFSAAILNATTNTKIDLTTSGTPIAFGNDVTVSYTAGNVKAADTGVLASFVAPEPVTNNMPAAAPMFVSAETNADGTVIIITFDKDMMADPTGNFGAFKYQIDGGADQAFSAAAFNATHNSNIDLTTSGTAIAFGDVVTVSYTEGTVTSVDTGVLASFADYQAVTNNMPAGTTFISIAPASGSIVGSTPVTITGSGFTGATAVTFDGTAATDVVVVTDTSITATTPAHAAGLVDVVVTTLLGPVTGTGATGYTYVASSASTVDLGTAGNFVILSKSGITDVPTSVITGNVGTSPITGASITGLECSEVTGTIYTVDDTGPACRVVDPVLLTAAVSDMEAAYTDAAGRIPTDYLNIGPGGDLAGLTLGPGIYTFTTCVTISNDVTLSGNSNDVWIFQIPGTLDISSDKQVILSGGAQAANIYWVVADATTLGTTSVFEGNILAKTNIALQTGATLNGRALAQTAVTLDQNTIRASPASAAAPAAPAAPAPAYNDGGSGGSDSESYPNAVSESSVNSGTSASAPESGQLAPSAASSVTPMNGIGSFTSTPLTADIVGMPGVSVSWTIQINDIPAQNAQITTVIQQNADQSTMDAFTTALHLVGQDIGSLAYVMIAQKTGVTSSGPATVTMTVSRDWIIQNGGIENIMIVRMADDGKTEVLPTKFSGYDFENDFLTFKVESPNGLSTFGLVAMKPYTPAAASIVSPAAPVSVQKAPTQAPAAVSTTTKDASTTLPFVGIALVSALIIIGVVVFITRRNK